MRYILFCLLPLWLFGQNMQIDINYGGVKNARTINTEYKAGESALAVLSRVAKVKTKKVGDFVFIVSIDGVVGKPQKMGWFYTVDDKGADKTASSYILTNEKSMRWEYHADNCLSGN
jgi:hypothetical protein